MKTLVPLLFFVVSLAHSAPIPYGVSFDARPQQVSVDPASRVFAAHYSDFLDWFVLGQSQFQAESFAIVKTGAQEILISFRDKSGRTLDYSLTATKDQLRLADGEITFSRSIQGQAEGASFRSAATFTLKSDGEGQLRVLSEEKNRKSSLLIFTTSETIHWTLQFARKKEPNQSPQRNAGSRPSSMNAAASETPSSLGPRG